MNAEQFFHVLRSAAALAGVREITVFGTSAVIPWLPGEAPELWPSMELDLDLGSDELNTLVDGAIGELSPFHETHGVYAHAVSVEVFTAPPKWKGRSKLITEPETRARVRVPRPLDVAVAKLVRGDEKDWDFAAYAVRTLGVTPAEIEAGLEAVAASQPRYAVPARNAKALVQAKLRR
jgi:hypothetical protein